jgi:cyclopropane fatty-acyl-phospholipid synthase-like methyltransferase
MSLADEYQRQLAWRSWPTILDELPLHPGQKVLDLGCAAGDLAAELVARGAFVIGVDLNEELLQAARAKGLSNAEFLLGDLRAPRGARGGPLRFSHGAQAAKLS